jgi:hypothetical protein
MRRIACVVLLSLFCGGCFESDKPLYAGVKPVTPFAGGPVTSRDKDGKTIAMNLAKDADGSYRLTSREKGRDFGKGYRVLFFAVNGLPSGALLAAVKDCEADFKNCASGSWSYLLVRPAADKVEWHEPDCSGTLSKLAGLQVESGSCKFADRASLDKAILAAGSLPWTADGAYLLH